VWRITETQAAYQGCHLPSSQQQVSAVSEVPQTDASAAAIHTQQSENLSIWDGCQLVRVKGSPTPVVVAAAAEVSFSGVNVAG